MLQQYTILKPFFLTSFFFPFLPSCQKKHTNTNRATIAMLGGAEPRPNHKLNKNVSPQRRHLGLSTYEPETLKVPISNSMLYHRQQHEINQPHQQQDHAIYHKQVEQQGFRFHQGQKFAARGQGVYRSAETNNDLRTLLANVPNPKLDQYKFSKRMFVNKQGNQQSRNEQSTEEQQDAPSSRGREAAVLNSDGVKNSMYYQAVSNTNTDTRATQQEKGSHTNNTTSNNTNTIINSTKTPIGTYTYYSTDETTKEETGTVTPRVQPSMISSLPIGWTGGSSWNPTPENSFVTSSQRQNSGQVVVEQRVFDQNRRRLGRNKNNTYRSQIVLG